MSSALERTSAHMLASSPNYLEVTVVITVVAASRFLFKSFFCSFSPRWCVSIASVAVVLLYACLGKGQIFTYLGWVAPRRPVYWLYAILAGVAGAVGALFILRGTGLSIGSAPATELLYGVTLGPVIEEVIFRGLHSRWYTSPLAQRRSLCTGGSAFRSSSLPCSLPGAIPGPSAFPGW